MKPPAAPPVDDLASRIPTFPGRWVGGLACVLGPLVLLAGVLLRTPHGFFFPQQLAAYDQHPVQMLLAYSTFTVGLVLLIPAVLTLAAVIGTTHPGWALWGATFTIAGLCARIFHAGVDHMAFQLVEVQGLEQAHQAVADSYTGFYVLQIANPLAMVGWIVLALGAFRSGTFGLLRATALGVTSALMIGVLKGTTAVSILAVSALGVALVPFGVAVLGAGPKPRIGAVVRWVGIVLVGLGALVFLGQAG